MCRNILFVYIVCLQIYFNYVIAKTANTRRVCVIGAGVAGLSSARYLKEEGITFTVLEATRYVGGTWRYDSRVGTDENGLPMRTSMYKDLRTNLPKPTMQLRGFPIPEELPSFPDWKSYYEYLQAYADHFNLRKHIQFLHNVITVRRVGDVWKVRHEHVTTGQVYEDEYDYVIVGNGHLSKPNFPNNPGEDRFRGTIIHSHDFRVPNPYSGRRVLIVGGGPSAIDIVMDVAAVSKTLVHSHHSRVFSNTSFPSHYMKKPDIKELLDYGVVFVDGSYEEIDDIIYCTGFIYDFPFLDESSGLDIEPRSVGPLYKYMVNINQPTMMIMGLVIRACLVITLDAQARYATAIVKGNFTLPSHEEMMQEWQERVDDIRSKGMRMSNIHVLAENEDKYYEKLTKESGIDRVPPVMYKIRVMDTKAKLENFYTYRNYVYTVIDNQTFTRSLEEKNIIKKV